MKTLQELDYSVLQQCMHCGMCLPTCPTYDTTKRERNSPRGRIALMRSIADGELSVNKTFAEEMAYCLGCLACQTACPAGVQYGVLFETARADVERADLPQSLARRFWRWLALQFLFMHPARLRILGRVLRWVQHNKLDVMAREFGLTRFLPADLRRLEPQAPAMSPAFSCERIQENEAPPAPKWRVAVLTGCVQDLAFSDVNRDTVDVLLANGCHVHTAREQPCCGSLHSHNGAPELAAALARRLIDLLPPERFDAIITNAGGCGSHLRHYSALLKDGVYAEKARIWDSKVRDIHEWLAEIGCRVPRPAKGGREVVVSYHDSCHLAHGQKVVAAPRALLQQLPGTRFVELPEASWCCGSAGVYSITQPEQSAILLERKIKHIVETGAQILATANPGCHLQLVNGLKARGIAMEVAHPVTLLARAYRDEANCHSENVAPRKMSPGC
ncbi:MAG: (Fe-S)-binding protein [Verrucomicrobia bacterium]|nr:(Fe-S)-binding protein [Verrucomicrobiota bacterium]